MIAVGSKSHYACPACIKNWFQVGKIRSCMCGECGQYFTRLENGEIKERNGDHKDDDESDVQTPGPPPGSIGSRGGDLESLAENPVLVGEDAHQRADEGQLEVEMEIKEHEEKSLNQQDSVALPVPDAPPAVVKPICSCDFCNHRKVKRFRAGLKKPASANTKITEKLFVSATKAIMAQITYHNEQVDVHNDRVLKEP